MLYTLMVLIIASLFIILVGLIAWDLYEEITGKNKRLVLFGIPFVADARKYDLYKEIADNVTGRSYGFVYNETTGESVPLLEYFRRIGVEYKVYRCCWDWVVIIDLNLLNVDITEASRWVSEDANANS